MVSQIKIFVLLLIILLTNLFGSCDQKDKPIPKEPKIDTFKYTEFAMGIDLSYVNQVEDHGGIYKQDKVQKDPYLIFKEHGANMVRLRLWHNPEWIKTVYDASTPIYSGFEDVAKSIERAKKYGLSVNLDFHYSDTWADPGKQKAPAAWQNITDIQVLCDSVYNYTYGVLNTLKQKNLLPEMVQIGNETNCGMMITETLTGFPSLNVCNGEWTNLGRVLNAGIKAVRDLDNQTGKNTIIALHVADPKNLDWYFEGIINTAGVTDFDVMGFSYYPIWHTTVSFNSLPALVSSTINKFHKDIMILETAYAFTTDNYDSYTNIYSNQGVVDGFPYTVEGQKNFMTTLTQNMINAGAKGVIYWEPAWISSNMKDLWGTGSSWENCTFFDFSGNLIDGINYLNYNYTK